MNLNYTFTPTIVRDLMAIEAARQTVTLMVLPLEVTARLRREARVRSTHYLSADYRRNNGGVRLAQLRPAAEENGRDTYITQLTMAGEQAYHQRWQHEPWGVELNNHY